MPGKLYLVATPIGNLQDITLRALEILRSVDIIACEDTRHSRKLLNHFEISNKLVSYHEHNEQERAGQLAEDMISGKNVAVISDAGTPGICDPGSRLVEKAIAAGIDVVAVPGPVAFAAAVTASGLPTDAIFFGGFLPARTGERRKRLGELADIPATIVLYEAPHRLAAMLADCLEVLGDRPAAVVRELTKLHEEIARGTLADLAARFTANGVKGEIVVAIDRPRGAGPVSSGLDITQMIAAFELEGLDHKAALKRAAKEAGVSRSEAYRRLISEKK